MDKEKAKKAVADLLDAIGEDKTRLGLKDTPQRVVDMLSEILAGFYAEKYEGEPPINFFDEAFGDMIIVRDIEFHSMCEHHLLPFYGVVHICYIPSPHHLLGISQLARIVETHARRLTIQENMTTSIADLLEKEAKANGVAVIIEASHLCMTMRGVKKTTAKTMTSALRGLFLKNAALRAEAMALLNK